MDEEIIIPPGIHGTRKLAAALADLMLRKRGMLNKYIPWSEKIHRRWTPAELKFALDMRAAGKSYVEIGKAVRRGKSSVHEKIGCRRAG